MKKFFALALAAAMVASMSAASFAAKPLYGTSDGGETVKKDDNKYYFPVVDAIGPFSYDADDKMLSEDSPEYGDTAYYALVQDYVLSSASDRTDLTDTANIQKTLVTESETVSSLKVKPKWEDGSKLVKSVSIVKKKVTNDNGTDTTTVGSGDDATVYPGAETLGLEAGYYHLPELTDSTYYKSQYFYFIAIALNTSTSTSDADINGTLTLSKSKAPKVDDLELTIDANVNWENSYLTDYGTPGHSDYTYTLTGDSPELEAEKYYALKFDSSIDDEIDICFEDDSIFTVDCSGQSKLLLYYDTDYNSKIAAKYPRADLNFWNGNGAKFNRVGEMFLSADQDYAQFLYQVNSDGTLSEVPGAEYDEYDGGFYFNTRVLGSYVISDMELNIAPPVTTTPVVQTPVVTTPAPVVTNPSTGAAA